MDNDGRDQQRPSRIKIEKSRDFDVTTDGTEDMKDTEKVTAEVVWKLSGSPGERAEHDRSLKDRTSDDDVRLDRTRLNEF